MGEVKARVILDWCRPVIDDVERGEFPLHLRHLSPLLGSADESLRHHLKSQKSALAGDIQDPLVLTAERQCLAPCSRGGTGDGNDAERLPGLGEYLDARCRDGINTTIVVDDEIVGAGGEAVLWGAVLVVLALPIHVLMRRAAAPVTTDS